MCTLSNINKMLISIQRAQCVLLFLALGGILPSFEFYVLTRFYSIAILMRC